MLLPKVHAIATPLYYMVKPFDIVIEDVIEGGGGGIRMWKVEIRGLNNVESGN